MTQFNPPISQREKEELIQIAYSSTDQWQQEAINQAKQELIKRNVTPAQQQILIDKWSKEADEYFKEETTRLEKNKTESYEVWEMAILFIFGPILFLRPFIFNSHSLFTLKSENYFLKFKQRLIILALSFISWFLYMDYTSLQTEKKRLEEIQKIDISDWKKEHGYD